MKRVSPIIVGHGLRVIDSIHRAMTFAVHCTLNSQTTASLTTSPSPLFTWRLPGPAQHGDGLVTLGTGVPPGRPDGYLPLEPSNQSRTPRSPIHPVPSKLRPGGARERHESPFHPPPSHGRSAPPPQTRPPSHLTRFRKPPIWWLRRTFSMPPGIRRGFETQVSSS